MINIIKEDYSVLKIEGGYPKSPYTDTRETCFYR